MAVRTAKVVDLGLGKVIAISMGSPELYSVREYNDSSRKIRRPHPAVPFPAKFALQFIDEVLLIATRGVTAVQPFLRFTEQSGEFPACPGPVSGKCAVNQTEGGQAIECRINPAVQRNIRRSLILRQRVSLAKPFANRSPVTAAQLGVVMAAIDLLRNQTAHDTADKDVCRKVLGGANPGVADKGGQAVREELGEEGRDIRARSLPPPPTPQRSVRRETIRLPGKNARRQFPGGDAHGPANT